MSGKRLLGPVTKWEGSQVAEVGKWLVIFKHNAAVGLHSPGVKVRKIFASDGNRAPAIGASIAVLDTSPQEIHLDIINAESSDMYVVPRIQIALQVRLAPENPRIAERILERINRDGEKFFDSIEATARKLVEQHVRSSIRSQRAHKIIEVGPGSVVFPDNFLSLPENSLVEVTALQSVDWTEDEFSRSVRERQTELVAARASEKIDIDRHDLNWRERERLAEAERHAVALEGNVRKERQKVDVEIAHLELVTIRDRAYQLGVDPLAIAEPQVWEQIRRDHAKIAETLMASPQLFQVVRNNPELMRAIFDRLSGATMKSPLARQADMVIDRVEPSHVYEMESGRTFAGDSDYVLRTLGATIEPTVNDAWKSSGAQLPLTGAGLTLQTGANPVSAWVILMTKEARLAPSQFKINLERELAKKEINEVKVLVQMLTGESIGDAITSAISNLSPAVRTSFTLREADGDREVFVELNGDINVISRIYEWLNDPENLTIPTLEQLTGDNTRIRLALPGV